MQSYLFPENFVWGATTAAYQIEGAVEEDGRGESIWDRFCHIPGNIRNGDTGDVACDHYHRWREDVRLMREMGLKAYRFSIAWPRIYPMGHGEINQKGLDFYSELVDALLESGIEPYVTLYHWDLPQALQDEGGWTSRGTAEHFADYAKAMFRALGTRVRHWITLNEPWVTSFPGHFEGSFAPGLRDFSAALQTAHHQLLAHGLAVAAFRAMNLPGEIGIALNLCPREGATGREEDILAARRNDGYVNRWFLDPLYRGEYPRDMVDWYLKKGAVLPKTQPGDLELISQKFDFLGINYYYIEYTLYDPVGWPLNLKIAPARHPRTDYGWPVVAHGLTDLLVRLDREYGHPKLLVTENGASYLDVVNVKGEVLDDDRIDYLERHIIACHDAIQAGADLGGYFVWSLTDNFEWNTGYDNPFGLIHIDRDTLDRLPKRSAMWYGRIVGNNGIR